MSLRCRALAVVTLSAGVGWGCVAKGPAQAAPVSSPAPAGAAARGQAVIPPVTPGAAAVVGAVGDTPAARAPGWLGVALTSPPAHEPGVIVSSVLRRSPAALGGLLAGDVVVAINDARVSDPAQMSEHVAQLGAGARASLMVQRAGQHRLLAVRLEENPGLEGQLRLGFVDADAPELEHVQVVQGQLAPSLSALRGQVVVLEFWATWCVACRALLPTLNDWHARLQASGGTVVSVTTDPVAQAARDAIELGLRYPVLSDPEGVTAQAYQAFALPTLFVIDRAGIVRDVSVGYDPQRLAQIQATLSRLLSES